MEEPKKEKKPKNKSKSKIEVDDKKKKKKPTHVSKEKKDNITQDLSEEFNQNSKLHNNISAIPKENEYQDNNNFKFNNENLLEQSPYPPIKCDGCYIRDAINYCVQCKQCYCKICDDQIHIVPSNRNHEKKSTNIIASLQKSCYLHSKPLKLFCESCEEPICQDCQMIGPHNNKLHKVVTVFDLFKKKFNYLSQLANKNMNNKYQEIMNQIQYLDSLSNNVKSIKNNLEKNIRKEYGQMLENLNSIEGKKLAIVNYENSNIQKNINDIIEITNIINETAMNDNPDMIDFLLKYKQINEKIEDILAKPIKSKYNINPEDFPHELEEKNKKILNYENLENLCQFKDEIIWKIITDDTNCANIKKLNEKSKLEIAKWEKLSDKYASELQKYNLVCKFCGVFLDENTVNTSCEKNTEFYGNKVTASNNMSENRSSVEIIGTKRHYFIPPSNSNN